ncbi:MAG: DUF2130 domain-containing protein [Terrimicrobiaceae bacterium]|nr:DUF2130 domain-containing protein [Terrimicrobiaceae bacterium]
MPDISILCPKCGAEFALSEAVTHRIREQLEGDFQKKLAERQEALAARERKIEEQQAGLEKLEAQARARIEEALAKERQRIEAEAARRASEKLDAELRDLRARLDSETAKRRAAEELELDLRKKARELEEARQSANLELARKLDEERAKIAAEAAQRAAEAERLNIAQKDKVITDLQQQIAALKQKAEQGSMQLQGETLELTLESDLRTAFPFDEIAEVKKGQRGADCLQTVRTNQGFVCGAILWEAKRARNWSNDWPEKLKADQREAAADLAVLVTTCPPEGLRGIGLHDGVWVCELPFALGLAAALRQGLISTAAQRVQQSNRADKAQALYDHVCGVGFRQHIEALVEAFLGLQEQLEAEKRAFAKQWKEREARLSSAITHTAMLYGGVQGIAGREALPEVSALALPGMGELREPGSD